MGTSKKIRYINREKTSKGFKFYVTSAPLYNYNEGDLVGIPESFFAHGTFNLDNSDIQNGLFSFDMTFVGDKLNSEMLFGGKPYIDISYMAMRILSNDGAVEEAECITAARMKILYPD